MSTPSERGFFGRLALTVMHNRALTTGVLAFLTLIAGFFASSVRIDSDILKLMPEDEPVTIAMRRLVEQEGGISYLTLAFESEDEGKQAAFMDELAGRLRALPDVQFVFYEVDPETTFRLGLLQAPMADLQLLHDRVSGALVLGPALTNPFMSARLFDLGPLSERLSGAGSEWSLTEGNGITRMMIHPNGSAQNLPFARKFMAEVDGILAELDPAAREVNLVWKGGAYRHNVEDYEGIVRDFGWITAASLIMVLVIIAAAFRSGRAVGLIFIPLVASNIWTLGIAGATVGSLNTFTSFVNAILIGLGVEFGVHLYARYRELRSAGKDVETAAADAWDLVGGACTSACFTSAAGFAALLAAHFEGFRQLGWLLSLGLVLTLIAELLLMPILFTVIEPKASHFHPRHSHHRRKRKFPMWYRTAPMALLLIGTFTFVSALLVKGIKFEYDLSELRQEGLAYEDLDEKERALARDSYSPMVASFETPEARDEAYFRLKKRMEDKKIPEFTRVLSVRTILPGDQPERVKLLASIAGMTANPSYGYLPPQVKSAIGKLVEFPPREIGEKDLPAGLQSVLGIDRGKYRVLIFAGGNMWDMREAAKLEAAVRRELPGVEVAGEFLSLGLLYRLMQQDAPIIAGIAFLLVCIFTWLDLRSIRSTLGALAVQLAGFAWWGALLALSDIRISIVNFVGIPIVMGIGIDVMIHMMHRLQQEGPGKIVKVLATTGWASALGTSTTVVAFAALSLASSQGIRSLGMLVLLGEMSVTVAGFLLIPLGFATKWHWERRAAVEEE